MPTNVNYVNPSAGGTPYGDWKPEGFLAGWQYADKMKDYRTTKDLSDESSFLANEMSRLQNRDFADLSNLNEVQRQVTRQRAGHELGRIPTEEGIKGMKADEEYFTLSNPRGREARIEKGIMDSIYALDTTKRKAAIDNAAAASTLLQGMSSLGDPNILVQQLEKAGVDVSGLHDPNPDILREKLHRLRSINPELLKSEYERRKQSDVDDQSMKRLEKELANRKEIAGMKSHSDTAAEKKEKELQRLGDVYIDGRIKQGVPKWQAEMEWAQIRARDPYFQQGAAGQREVDTPQATLDSFKGKPTTIPNQAPVPKQTMNIPELGEVEIVETLPGGSFKVRKGNKIYKWSPN